MPRTMLTDQHWQKLKVILRNLSIHHNSNLRNFIEAILYRIRTGCPWRDIPSCFGHSNSILNVLIVGQPAVSYLDYSNC
jgi:transposase